MAIKMIEGKEVIWLEGNETIQLPADMECVFISEDFELIGGTVCKEGTAEDGK